MSVYSSLTDNQLLSEEWKRIRRLRWPNSSVHSVMKPSNFYRELFMAIRLGSTSLQIPGRECVSSERVSDVL